MLLIPRTSIAGGRYIVQRQLGAERVGEMGGIGVAEESLAVGG